MHSSTLPSTQAPAPALLKPGIALQNHAMSGRNTKSFRDEGRWQTVADQLKPGDFVVLGFGHNDQKIQDPSRYAEPWTDYTTNLNCYIDEARLKGRSHCGNPIRRHCFGEQGKLQETLDDYPEAASQSAKEQPIPSVDLNQFRHAGARCEC